MSRKKGVRMARRPRGSRSLSKMSVSQLQAEINRRVRSTRGLHKRRAKLVAKLTDIDSQILAAGGAVEAGGRGGRGRKRAQNAMSLVETLQKVLKTKTLSVTEAAAAAQKAGYVTTADNFRTIVNQALIKHTDKFKKVERGQYTAA